MFVVVCIRLYTAIHAIYTPSSILTKQENLHFLSSKSIALNIGARLLATVLVGLSVGNGIKIGYFFRLAGFSSQIPKPGTTSYIGVLRQVYNYLKRTRHPRWYGKETMQVTSTIHFLQKNCRSLPQPIIYQKLPAAAYPKSSFPTEGLK